MSRELAPDPRRALPAVDRLAGAVRARHPELPTWAATAGARAALQEARSRAAVARGVAPPALGALESLAAGHAVELTRPHPRRVVNATGVVLHTNLGRALLAPEAAEAARAAAVCYGDLELDPSSGRRGDRQGALARKLALLAGAEAALAVNNNAGALVLAVAALARDREVVVSRGELVEIGGSFRLHEILEAAGARLVEVGTTNRTHLDDYARAIGPATALLLKVHQSNFEQRGFVAEVELAPLAALAREHRVPLLEDLGSATLVDLRAHGLTDQRAHGLTDERARRLPESSWAPARLRLGADLVCFSGDKLFGGPQAGLLLGRADCIEKLRRHPLARALRLDKMTLAALDWTVSALLEGAPERLPALRQLLEPGPAVERRARALAARLAPLAATAGLTLAVAETRAPVGGGSLPGFELPSWAVALGPGTGSVEGLAARLRAAAVPVIARVSGDAVLLDARTLLPEDGPAIEAALAGAARGEEGAAEAPR